MLSCEVQAAARLSRNWVPIGACTMAELIADIVGPSHPPVQPAGAPSETSSHQADILLGNLQLAPHVLNPSRPPTLPFALPCRDDMSKEDYGDAIAAAFAERCPFMVCRDVTLNSCSWLVQCEVNFRSQYPLCTHHEYPRPDQISACHILGVAPW